MKISEFAEKNNVTPKMLRHYDKLGLLKPVRVDEAGYRMYDEEQSNYLSWIVILKNLQFSLKDIAGIINRPVDSGVLIQKLRSKRIEIYNELNARYGRIIAIDRLIRMLETEGFNMDQTINLTDISADNINEIKKNFPNMEMFLEKAGDIISLAPEGQEIAIFRLDICHFKSINDEYGHEVGDKVIVGVYDAINTVLLDSGEAFAFGRSSGDEFVWLMPVGKPAARSIAESVIQSIKRYDFAAMGCEHEIGCYIGVLVTDKNVKNIRQTIDDTIELTDRARQRGRNMVEIR